MVSHWAVAKLDGDPLNPGLVEPAGLGLSTIRLVCEPRGSLAIDRHFADTQLPAPLASCRRSPRPRAVRYPLVGPSPTSSRQRTQRNAGSPCRSRRCRNTVPGRHSGPKARLHSVMSRDIAEGLRWRD